VAPPRITEGVREFVAEHIHSVTQLELLMLLHRDPAIGWTPDRAAAEMRLPGAWVAEQLERFVAAGLLVPGGAEACFRYRTDAASAAVVDELAQLYRRRRTTVTSLIFTPAADDVRLLSDAFLIRRGKEE
jgi:hypothetical protein